MLQKLLSHRRYCPLLAGLTFAFALMPATAKSAAPADRTQALISDAAMQFQLAYRLQPTEAQRREAELTAVVAAWRAAPRSEANNKKLTAWLHTAIRVSMPGSREALPPLPAFTSHDKATEKTLMRTAEPTPVLKSPAVVDEKSTTDPFRDDPWTDQE